MSKKNGFLTLKIVLAMGIVLVCIMAAIARYSGGQTPHVSGPEELRRVLWRQQMLSLPQLPQDGVPVFVDAGDFVYAGTNEDAIALADGLVPAEGENGTLCWPVTLFEDVSTRETVFLNADGEEAGRLSPPLDYDPLWLLESFFPDGVPDDVDEAIYDPALVVVTATLLAETEGERPGSHAAVASGGRAGAFAGRLPGASADTAAGTRAATGTGGVRTPPGKTETPVERSVLGGGSGSNQVYYADASRPDDGGDGLTWATAKRTIQAAVDLAAAGDTVLVTNGVYSIGTRITPGGSYNNRLVITNGVTVRSLFGASVTVIEGSGASAYDTAGAIRCVYMPDGVLDGFTLQGGATVADWTSSNERDKGGGGVSMLGATSGTEIRNCVLRNNTAFDGGGAYRGRVVNCVLFGNAASYGSAVYWCDVKNCTLSGNVGDTFAGGGACGGALTNSISFGNVNAGGDPNYFGCEIGYSCTTPLPAGDGNIALDPLFAGASSNDFTLSAGSPCVNAGTNGLVATDTDLGGHARIRAGRVDMGAYELQTASTVYADASRPDDGGDGLTWATAKRTIQAAVDIASDGDLVLVTNGVYDAGSRVTPGGASMNRLVITHAVTVRSVGGAGVTVILGEGGADWTIDTDNRCRCVYMTDGILDGFTLEDGGAGNPSDCLENTLDIDNAGGCVSMFGASEGTEVRNCVIRSGCADFGGGAFAGRLVNCVLHDDIADYGGGCALSALWNCTVADNYSIYCAAVYNCSVTNSVVYGTLSVGGGADNHSGSQFGYSCSTPLPAGTGNIDQDPQFAAATNAEYRLLAWSPCINAGDNASQMSETDLLGNARVRGGTVDMGAYEMSPDGDIDGDGLTDSEELQVYRTSAVNPDTDGDGLDDAEEVFSRVLEWGLQTNTTSWVTPPEHFGKITRLRAANGTQLSYFQHNAALKATGEAVCWGYNSSGQCNVPESATNLVDIAAGGNHVAALRDNGTVVCWGRNLYGECTPPTGAVDVVAVSAGWYHNAAVKSNGTVVCWGYNNYGQCTVTSGLSNVKAVAAGGCHTVALLVDGSVICWGSNSSGQCAVTSGVSNVKAVAAGGSHSMALLDGGAVVCWGNNAQGQCSVPAGVTNAVAISAGSMHSMACLADGRIVSWGWNSKGQSAPQTPYAAVLDLDGASKYSVALVAGNTDPLDADSDDDGLEDGAEVSVHKTDPNNPDTDGDGLPDGAEIALGTGVFDPDSDDDGLKDGWEVRYGFEPLAAGEAGLDPDEDNLSNAAEQDRGTDPRDADSDDDSLEDGDEVSAGTNPAAADTDGDGLDDNREYDCGTNPVLPHSDSDGMCDGWEVSHGFLPLVVQTDGVHGPADDPDGDGLTNAEESILWTDPFSDDTDRDGLKDGWESENGFNPLSGRPRHLSEKLLGWWQFADVDGTNVTDLSGHGNSAYIYIPEHVSCASSYSALPLAGAHFDGQYDSSLNGRWGYVGVPGLTNTTQSSPISVTAWMRLDSLSASYSEWLPLFKGHDPDAFSAESLYLVLSGFANDGCELDFSPSCAESPYPYARIGMATGEWVHVCGVTDGTTATLYVNGRSVASAPHVPPAVGNTGMFWIGSVFGQNGYPQYQFHGDIADVRFYASGLTSNDVAGLVEFRADADGDGLSNLDEQAAGTDPRNPDSDGDGVSDGPLDPDGAGSVIAGPDPFPLDSAAKADTDGDGMPDELFGISSTGLVEDTDDDNDGMPDVWESQYGFDPKTPCGDFDDWDGDGLSNLQECQFSSNPKMTDTDGDSLNDYFEWLAGLNPNVSDVDTDLDGMPDEWESYYGCNPLSGLTNSLVGWWQFREGCGTNSVDLSGNGNTAYILFTNQVSWATNAPIGKALNFSTNTVGVPVDYDGGYVCVPGLSDMNVSNGFSMAAWVRAESYPTFATLFTKSSDHLSWPDGMSLYYHDSDSMAFYAGDWSNGINYVSSGMSDTGGWYHVCGVYDGTNVSIFINGRLCGTGTNVAGRVVNADPLWIGSTFKSSHWLWHGDVADARIYTAALSTNAIAELLEFMTDADNDGFSMLEECRNGTDPFMSDTDGDGIGDASENVSGSNPMSLDTDGDGMPDGGDPFPLQADSSFDGDGDGLPDVWEVYRFGGTNVTSAADADTNGDGFTDRMNMLTGTDAAAVPSPGFAVTNVALAAGLDAWEISPAFALSFPEGVTTVVARSQLAYRTSPWQQFYVSSDPGTAAGWALDGLELTWECGTNSGKVAASPSGDSLRLDLSPVGAAGVDPLSFRLSATRQSGLVRSSRPLYLVRWTPQVAFAAGEKVTTAVSATGIPCVAAVLESGGLPALSFTIDQSARPHKAAPSPEELAERMMQPDPASAVKAVFTYGLSAGYLTAPVPSEASLPACGTNKPVRVLLYKIKIISDGKIDYDRPFGQYSSPYPLNSAALRSKWRNNAIATGDLAPANGFMVSTGIDSEYLTVYINGELGNTYSWPKSSVSKLLSRSAVRKLSACGGGGGGDCSGATYEVICCSNSCAGGGGCVEYEPDEGTTPDTDSNTPYVPPSEPPPEPCGCCGGEGSAYGSIKFRIPLGSPGRDRISGFLWFAMETPQPVTVDLFNILGDFSVLSETNNGIVTVTSQDVNGRSLTLSNMNHGVCVLVHDSVGTLEHQWNITNPEGNTNAVRLVKIDPADNRVSDETYFRNVQSGVWDRTDNLTGASETLEISGDLERDGLSTETRTLTVGGTILSKTVSVSEVIGVGDTAVARVTDLYTWDGYKDAYRNTHSDYWTDTSVEAKRNGLLRLRYGDDIAWEYHAYDGRGREVLGAGPLEGSVRHVGLTTSDDVDTVAELAALEGLSSLVKVYSYEPVVGSGDSAYYNDSRKPRVITSYRLRDGVATVISREWRVYIRSTDNGYQTVNVRKVRAASSSAAYANAANAVSLEVRYVGAEDASTPPELWNLPVREEREDGSVLTWAYEFGDYVAAAGTFTANEAVSHLRVTSRTGTAASASGVAYKSTYTVEIRDAAFGRVLRRETLLHTGGAGDPVLSWEMTAYDAKDHVLSVSYSDGTAETNVWDCCRMQAKVGRDGIRTEYWSVPGVPGWAAEAEVSLGGLPGSGGGFPVTETYNDAIGRGTNSMRCVWKNGSRDAAYAALSSRTEYPFGTDGYSVMTDPVGVTTVRNTSYGVQSETESAVTAGVTNRTTRTFGGATVTEKFWDGKWTRETRSTAYNADGCRVETVFSEASDLEAPVVASATSYDFLGRVVSVALPLGVTFNYYDGASDRLLRVSRTGSPDTLYVYDELGNVLDTVLDGDGDGAVDYDGLDRVTRSQTVYQQNGSVWWQTTSNQVWNAAGSDTPLLISVSSMRLTGLGGAASGVPGVPDGAILTAQSETRTRPTRVSHHLPSWPTTRSYKYSDRVSATVWDVTDTPESGQNAVRVGVGGYAVSDLSATGHPATYTYDGFGRQVTVTDGQSNTAWTVYNALGQTLYTEDAASNRTSFAYDAFGRRTAVTNALGQATDTAYDSEGHVVATWGATYPVAYAYDTAGRRVAMATTRDPAQASVNLLTLLPAGVTLSDTSHPSYPSRLDTTRWLYDHATGLLTNKVYADGNGTAYTYAPSGRMATRTWARGVITSYGYDTLGQLVSVDYSDGTPDVTNAYDRLGRKISALSAVSTNLFDYNQDTYLYKETQNNDTLTRAYTAAGQPYATGVNDKSNYYDVWELYGPYEFAEIYDYDEFGRTPAVISVHSLDAEWSNYAITGFGYQYLAGSDQIESVIGYADQYWGSYAPPISRVVSRDPRRGVITGVSNFWNAAAVSSHTYQNDALGRRTARADVLNDSGVPVEIANAFGYNQRSEVTEVTMGTNSYGYAYDPIGSRIVTTENTETTEYVANGLNQYTAISNQQSAVSNPAYDWDGNLLTNGVWSFTWDAENRLVSACSNNVLLVTNTYDPRSRRIRKEVSVWDPQLTAYRSQSTASFLWDNWNVIREVQHSNIPSFQSSTNYYTWGVDLSGSLQGAGGVGGLLAVTTTDTNSGTSTNYYPVYDASGNVTAYLDAGGSTVAAFEYDAFGATVAVTGPLADAFTHRFSTKPFDAETGSYYFGYRHYGPQSGRWFSRDPIEERGGLNLYGFVGNDPVNKWDYLGKKKCCCKETKKEFECGYDNVWKGSCFFSSLGWAGLSGWNLSCHFTSNLMPGCSQFHAVSVEAYGVSGSFSVLPSPISFYGFNLSFIGNPKTPDGFKGPVRFGSVGGALGVGGALSSITIGDGVSTGIGGEKGFDIPNLSGGTGWTTSVRGRETPCRSWDPWATYF